MPPESAAAPLELSIVVPTFNERENILPLLERLRSVLDGTAFEVIFVDDDSPDGTAGYVREIAQREPGVRVIQRIGRRGLASAGLEGILATSAPYVALMDADLQHDESLLPRMLEKIRAGELDLVIGSRNMAGGGMGEFTRERVWLSQWGRRISKLVSRHELSDPMSGYFMLTREFFDEVMRRTAGVGFKILLDLVASSPRPVRFAELPYVFRTRQRGESKLDVNVVLEYLYLVLDKSAGGWVPIRFVLFCMVGAGGAGVYLAAVWLLYRGLHLSYSLALLAAIAVAMVGNFALNNVFTYSDRRRRGWGFVSGLLLFCAACSVGGLCNYALAQFLRSSGMWWPVASICGLAVASVWNYGATAIVTWRPARRRSA
ncbi:MAG TPA: glycosyltransferase family 2 protein [Bryobacteraceae bacterium]|nr:glycosyltransferase family 2 protein [Bryobacteraceae bacterium]